MQCVTDYISHGVPLEQYELTRKDRRTQRDLEERRKWVEIQFAKFSTTISPENAVRLAELFQLDEPAPPKVRWRVRLFCGRITEVIRCAGSEPPNSGCQAYERCGECDSDQVIVAYEPLGPV